MELAGVVDLDELQQYLDAMHPGVSLDAMDSESHIRFMVFVRKIFSNPDLLRLIQVYVERDRK